MQTHKVALLILFNHNYEKNIEILEKIYKDRFTNIYFIMPFYQGEKPNVLSVYENSFYFQGYIVQALNQLKNEEFDRYIIIGDDLILNPSINQTNYADFFSLKDDSAFISGFFRINDSDETRPYRPFAPYWAHQESAIDFKLQQHGIEASKYMPSYDEALSLINSHGLNFTAKMPRKMFIPSPLFKRELSFRSNIKRLRVLLKNAKYLLKNPQIPYPLIASYSDIIILPKKHKAKFELYAGIFAALHLFVEIAIPSALVYSVSNIVTEDKLAMKGRTYWGAEDFERLESEYSKSLSILFDKFPADCLYIHPIKLSSWH